MFIILILTLIIVNICVLTIIQIKVLSLYYLIYVIDVTIIHLLQNGNWSLEVK